MRKTATYIGSGEEVKGNNTVRTGIIEPDFLTLELPLLVRSTIFCFFSVLSLGLRGQFSQCSRAPIQEGEFQTS